MTYTTTRNQARCEAARAAKLAQAMDQMAKVQAMITELAAKEADWGICGNLDWVNEQLGNITGMHN